MKRKGSKSRDEVILQYFLRFFINPGLCSHRLCHRPATALDPTVVEFFR